MFNVNGFVGNWGGIPQYVFFNGENDEQLVDTGARPFQTLRRIYISDHLDSKPEYHPLVIYKDAGKDEILAPMMGQGTENWFTGSKVIPVLNRKTLWQSWQ